jgi:hypothetical protein
MPELICTRSRPNVYSNVYSTVGIAGFIRDKDGAVALVTY